MAKKRFTDNLFGLFDEVHDPAPTSPEKSAVPHPVEEESVEVEVPVKKTSRNKLSSKNFTQDLDAFLHDSMERESVKSDKKLAKTTQKPTRRRGKKRASGLDLLIRSTVDENSQARNRSGNTAETKRVTLIFNRNHLEKLKKEAKERGVYLKDVVQEMVIEYLEK